MRHFQQHLEPLRGIGLEEAGIGRQRLLPHRLLFNRLAEHEQLARYLFVIASILARREGLQRAHRDFGFLGQLAPRHRRIGHVAIADQPQPHFLDIYRQVGDVDHGAWSSF
ncbi:MAG: hypothetical protein MUF47_00825 [Porphyrobacter sp.]|nr:hypothetical protein [Porphyrobacter sp.]